MYSGGTVSFKALLMTKTWMPQHKPKVSLPIIIIGKFSIILSKQAIKLMMLNKINDLLIPNLGATEPPMKDPMARPMCPTIVNIVILFKNLDYLPAAACHPNF